MAQAQKQTKQPQDPYARRVKELTSAVQRLRGWIGTDASKRPDLVDALITLNAHRLLGHAFAATAPDTQEAVRLASALLVEPGPIGPYSTAADATRCGTALVHVAVVQAAMGAPDGAGRTLESWDELRGQLAMHRLELDLAPSTVVWALATAARARLGAGDVAGANAYVDAALSRLAESGLRDDPDAAYLAVEVDHLASDGRWAAGHAEDALGFLHTAKNRYDAVVSGRLDQPGRLGQVLLERLAEPAFGLSSDLADRLVATDRAELGLVTRRALIEHLRVVGDRLGDPARIQLATALTDLADDLRTLGREDEADAASTEATSVSRAAKGATGRSRAPLGAEALSWTPLAAAVAYASDGDTETAVVPDQQTTAWLETETARAREREAEELQRARVEAERRRQAGAEAAQAEAQQIAAEKARADEVERRRAAELAAAEEAEQTETKRRRAERLREHEEEQRQREAAERAAERTRIEGRIAAIESGPATAAQLAEAERLRWELSGAAAALRQAQDTEEKAQDAEDRTRAADPDELEVARAALAEARQGDRRAVRAALERFVEVLRPRADTDGPVLQAALEELASARLRGGDLFGSRAAAKEARTLGKALRG